MHTSKHDPPRYFYVQCNQCLSTLIRRFTVLCSTERTNRRYPISSESVHQSHLQLEVVYSTLGDHRPNPCSNRRNQGLVNTISTLNND